jgi:hypothetical protein
MKELGLVMMLLVVGVLDVGDWWLVVGSWVGLGEGCWWMVGGGYYYYYYYYYDYDSCYYYYYYYYYYY